MGQDYARFPFGRIRLVAEAASSLQNDDATLATIAGAFYGESAQRYWAAMGALMRKKEGAVKFHDQLVSALSDEVVDVRIPAAEALARHGTAEESSKALDVLVELANPVKHGFYVACAALNALDYLDAIAMPRKAAIAALPADDPTIPAKVQGNLPKLREKLLADLE
jgi:HEAT repeat protein